ncbi:SNF2 domain-containing protein CLASSY isoform X1 [Spatholobus suberectus]|nr:SNF2 domain-containing protein CLASSY isoform X1 [Spatholobus suberectus]
MQILGHYFAKYPRLVNQSLKVVTNHNEETLKFEGQQVTGLTHQNVIDLEGEDTEKDLHAAPNPVVIIDSDEEDDRDKKSIVPFREEVVLPRLVAMSPELKMINCSISFQHLCCGRRFLADSSGDEEATAIT